MVNDDSREAPDAETPPSGTVLTTIVLEDNMLNDNGITDNMLECYGLSKTIKLLAIIDIFFSFFYLFYNPYLIIPLLFNFIGYKGAKDFDYNKIQCYLIFLILYNLLRISSWCFYIYNNENYNEIFLGTFFVLLCFFIEVWIIRVVYRLKQCLYQLSNVQLDIIKHLKINYGKRVYW